MIELRIFILLLLLCAACGKPALPPAQPTEVYSTTLESSWAAAVETKGYAAQCRSEADETAKLAAEARKALEEAKELHKQCQAIVKRIPRRVVKAEPKPSAEPTEVKKPKAGEKPKSEKMPEKMPEPPRNNEGPLYSPSDAP